MNTIEVEYDGIMLCARPACIHPAGVSVEMIKPPELAGIRVGTSHIPSFAMLHCKHFARDGVLTERGFSEIGRRMMGLYKAHMELEKRSDKIRESVSALYKSFESCFRSEEVIPKDKFYELRIKLRKELKNGNLNSKGYEKKLIIFKKGLAEWHSINRQIEESIIRIMLSMISDPDSVDRDSLLQLIANYGIWKDDNLQNRYKK